MIWERVWGVVLLVSSSGCASGGGGPASKPVAAEAVAERPPKNEAEAEAEAETKPEEVAPSAVPVGRAPGPWQPYRPCEELGQRCAEGMCMQREGQPFECVIEAELHEDFSAPDLLGKRIGSLDARFEAGSCTKMNCSCDKLCCNSCQARLMLQHKQALPPLTGSVDECSARNRKPHMFVGVIERDEKGEVALRLDWFAPAPTKPKGK
jgi:hypothetical protein